MAQMLGMVVFMATLVPRGRLPLHPVQWWAITAWCQRTGNWSDKITVPQWVLSEMAWWSSLAVLQGLPLASRETEVTLFTDASSSGWGAQLGSHVLNTGTVVCISKIVTHKRAGYAGRHQRCESLPSSSEIPGGSLDVRQRCDGGVHQERGGHTILHSHATDNMPVEVVRSQGDKTSSHPSARSARRIRCPESARHWTLSGRWPWPMERLRPVFAKWGEPQVDLFATFANRRLIRFASLYPDPRAEFMDAMSVPWDSGRGLLHTFPLFKMIPQVLQKIAQSQDVQMILIAPLQETASWFPELLELSQDPIPLHVALEVRQV